MAAGHGSKAKLFSDAYDLSGYLSSAGVAKAADTAEVSTLGATSKLYIPGLKDGTISADGYFFGAAGEVDAILDAALGVAKPLTFWPQGDALGAPGQAGSPIWTGYEVTEPVDGAGSITLGAQADGGLDRVLSLVPKGAVAGNGNSTGIDNAVATAAGGVGVLHVFVVGSGTLVVKIQDSLDNGTFADILTFSSKVSPAVGGERIVIAGTVRRYVRALWTITGSATFAVGFARR